MSMIHECAVEFLTSIGKNSQESFFQVSASPDQIDSETFHRVSAPPNLDSSGISHQVSAHNLDQKSTGEGWEHNEPNESDEPIQEVSWYDTPGVPHEPDQSGKSENEFPLQDDVEYRTVSPVVGNSETETLHDTCDTLSQDSDVDNNTAYRRVSSIVKNCETKMLINTYSNPVITNQNANIANDARPNSNPPITPGQHVECPQKEMHCKSKCMKTEKLGQNIVKPQHPDLNKTNSKLKLDKGHRTHKSKKK